MNKMNDPETELVMGPIPGANKVHQSHRDLILPKLQPRIQVYARKMREMYFREGTIPTTKSYLEAVRERRPTDTLESLMDEQLIPAVIQGRDEFPDVDLVMKWKTPFRVQRADHSFIRPFYIKHPETEEEIRVTCVDIDYHNTNKLPYFMRFQRYVVGRPNLLNMPVVPVQEDKSYHFQAGCQFHFLLKDVWCWNFTDIYPG